MTDERHDAQPQSAAADVRHAYANQWNVFTVHCRDERVAARYAASQNWWLHCWSFAHAEHDEPRVVLNGAPEAS